MKKINTLVEDIYSLFDLSAIDMSEEDVDKYVEEFGEMVKLHTKKFLYAEESVHPAHVLSFYMVIFLKSSY